MKLNKVKDDSNTLGVKNTKEFTIDTSNQMIVSILRDRLYSNKIGAVCREVASNSRDANREAGRESKPIVIEIGQDNSLLGEEKLYISFQDSGIGISPDRIDNVFLKYGSSTKRDTNSQTGGFGIGAKTPFAYNNEFIVETVSEKSNTENVKNIYQAIILNQNGVESSQLIHILSETTKEKTGTKIIVPIKSERDKHDFENEILKATILWDVSPILKGFSVKQPELTTLFSDDSWSVVSGVYGSLFGVKQNDFVASVDGILYKIDRGNVYDNVSYPTIKLGIVQKSVETYHYEDNKTNVILKFNTGELTLSASREDIEMTDDNLALIESRLLKMEKGIIKKGEKLLKKQKTTLSKIDFINGVTSGNHKEDKLNYLNSIKLFKHIESSNDLPKTTRQLFFSQDIYLINNPLVEKISLTKKNLLESNYVNLNSLKEYQIIFKNNLTRMNYRQNETLKKLNKPLLFVNISPAKMIRLAEAKKNSDYKVDKKIFDKETCLKALSEENITTLIYEEVEKAKVVRSKTPGVKRDKDIKKLYVRKANQAGYIHKDSVSFNKKTKTLEEVDLSNTIILNMTSSWEINSLDRVKIYYNRIEQFKNDESVLSKLDCSGRDVLKFFRELDYDIIILKYEDYQALDKKGLITAENVIDKLSKNKDNRKLLKAILKERHFDGVDALSYNDDDYKEYNNELGKSYLKLVDFNLADYKVINKTKAKSYNIKDNEKLQVELKDNKLWSMYSDSYGMKKIIGYMASTIKESFKMKMFEGYVNSEILENQEEKIKKEYPLFHYMFSELRGYVGWTFSDYDLKGECRTKGHKAMKDNLLSLINKELENK